MNDFQDRYENWHGLWSYIKSAIRIAACLSVIVLDFTLVTFALMFLFAELVGVVEEWF